MLESTLHWATRRSQLFLLAALGPRRVERLPSFRRALEPVDRLLFELIAERRRDPALDERDDILSLLLQARHEDGSPMSDEELRDELMTLLVAGHETTATALSWALERLVRHPDKLERLREEANAGGDEYTDAVAKEALRLRPVLPIVVRRLTEPYEIGGYTLPAGVTVAPCIYLVHRNPRVYPDPRGLPARALPRAAGGHLHLDPLRRRRAALHRRQLRRVRDEDRAGGDRRGAWSCIPPTRPRSAWSDARSP